MERAMSYYGRNIGLGWREHIDRALRLFIDNISSDYGSPKQSSMTGTEHDSKKTRILCNAYVTEYTTPGT
jgi:hypothetical protein